MKWSARGSVLVFAAAREEHMPGGASVRRIQIDPMKLSAKTIADERYEGRGFGDHQASAQVMREKQMRKALTMRALTNKPDPVWAEPSVMTALAGAYFEVGGMPLNSWRHKRVCRKRGCHFYHILHVQSNQILA